MTDSQVLKIDSRILANNELSFGTNFEVLGQLGWSKNGFEGWRGGLIRKIKLANYDAYFRVGIEILGQSEWTT